MGPLVAIEHTVRDASPRVLARLIRQLGDLQLAEDMLQEATLEALTRWPAQGVPDEPAAWLSTVARNRGFDVLRRRASQLEVGGQEEQAQAIAAPSQRRDDALDSGVDDDELRLLFSCAHPALSQQAQVALSLRTLGGLTTAEVARAFCEPQATCAQRLVRAKARLLEAKVPYEVPSRAELPERVPAVLAVVYLLFNEGYSATEGPALLRADLCQGAIRLGRQLAALLPFESEVKGLLALMLLHDARKETRIDDDGAMLPLERQPRELWSRERIDEGVRLLDEAIALRRRGPYQVQAAIAALHATAPSAEATDWAQIALLYEALLELSPSPMVALSHAAAVAMRDGPAAGLSLLELLDPADYSNTHLWASAWADLCRRAGQRGEALRWYEQALDQVRTTAERKYLLARRAAL